jgi:hypothetical protein
MIKGINNQAYINIEPYLDMVEFDAMQSKIYRGFAEAREFAKEGTWMRPGFKFDAMSYTVNFKPVYKAIEEFLQLPDDHPIKVEGMPLYKDFGNFKQRNKFTRYVKHAMGAYDPYVYYFLWGEGSWSDRTTPRKLTSEAEHFPELVSWVEKLVSNNIFEYIGRVLIFHLEADGLAFEHRDLGEDVHGILGDSEYTAHRNEFIHIRPNTKKAFYIWDPDTKNKIYLNTRAAWFNDQDWHGGEKIMEQSYSLRIDGKFTEEFRKKLGVNHLDFY